MTISIMDYLASIPAGYASTITRQLRALNAHHPQDTPYRVDQRGLPLPIWARRGLPDGDSLAWATLRDELRTSPVEKPFCFYVHIPFCDSRCEFCDCYAFALRRHQDAHTHHYTNCLIEEIDGWAKQGNLTRRPVTTVHFGGGTPTMLGHENLERLIQTLQNRFAIDSNTEWALETTSSSLDERTFDVLHELGFTRLHIGVQSLQDETRQAIGRREAGATVIRKIEKALSLGWIVSVDIITGLPRQSAQGLLQDLECLVQAGVEGFSIYELQHSKKNHRFFIKNQILNIPAIQRYLLFQLAFQHLEVQGYSMNVFNHLAKGRDKNLYFTFPKRGEDLLALGATADGSFGNYHYRHPVYLPYVRQVSPQNPGLLGGLRRASHEDQLHTLETQLMSGQINHQCFREILGDGPANGLIRRWREHQMIQAIPANQELALTPNGAWFTGQLLQETMDCHLA